MWDNSESSMQWEEEIESDEVCTMEGGRCWPMRIDGDDDRGGGSRESGEGEVCRRVTIWEGLFWHATCVNSFHPHSSLQSKQYVLLLLLSCFGHVQLCATLWTVACQLPMSMASSRQEYCSGLPCPPGYFPNPGIKPRSPALQVDSLPLSHQGSPNSMWYNPHFTEGHEFPKSHS